MATDPVKVPRPWRKISTLIGLLVLVYGSLIAGQFVFNNEDVLIPDLALDLEGGTQVILTPLTTDGSEITEEDINQAIEIIRNRVDASGVSEAEISSQGGQNIVVGLPGEPSQDVLNLVRQSAQLRFRSFLVEGNGGAIDVDLWLQSQESAEGDESEDGEDETDSERPTVAEAARLAADIDGDGVISTEPTTTPTGPTDLAWITEELWEQYYLLDCTKPENLVGGGGDDPDAPLVACSTDGIAKYILGPQQIAGTEVVSAEAGLATTSTGAVTNSWIVSLEFNKEAGERFTQITTDLASMLGTGQNRFAIVLDGLVVVSPSVSETIAGGSASISGSQANPYTREQAMLLANQLNFGSLPLDFQVQSEEQISASLGDEQLKIGIVAGLIGLLLVVFYTLSQYRGLAFVTLTSLLTAGVLTYGVISLLSWVQGYRLSLAGVAGIIVSIGIVADSFILYFERIRDEVREGRHLDVAVSEGWVRARRTILISDAVNLLAAVVLYFLSVGGVRGFAFTLGLMTIIDLIVVFMFTRPIMEILIKTNFFGGGHKLSGLSPEQLGATRAVVYRGRGQFARPDEGLSLAERKLRSAQAEAMAGTSQESDS